MNSQENLDRLRRLCRRGAAGPAAPRGGVHRGHAAVGAGGRLARSGGAGTGLRPSGAPEGAKEVQGGVPGT